MPCCSHAHKRLLNAGSAQWTHTPQMENRCMTQHAHSASNAQGAPQAKELLVSQGPRLLQIALVPMAF